jgi:hypothetical protein
MQRCTSDRTTALEEPRRDETSLQSRDVPSVKRRPFSQETPLQSRDAPSVKRRPFSQETPLQSRDAPSVKRRPFSQETPLQSRDAPSVKRRPFSQETPLQSRDAPSVKRRPFSQETPRCTHGLLRMLDTGMIHDTGSRGEGNRSIHQSFILHINVIQSASVTHPSRRRGGRRGGPLGSGGPWTRGWRG